MNTEITEFKMPRFKEIPNVGLYLEQTTKYINECLAPLDITVTASMLSNYVKKGYVEHPVKKQYYADQIAYLFFMSVTKQALSMENILTLFELQKKTYSVETAYDYFCSELENGLHHLFELEEEPAADYKEMPFAKKTLQSVITAISHIIYLNYCFKNISKN